jgi:hypothetical protein
MMMMIIIIISDSLSSHTHSSSHIPPPPFAVPVHTLQPPICTPSHIPPTPSQSQSTLYSHQSAHLSLSLLFLPFSCQFMAVLLQKMFPPTAGKSKFFTHCQKCRIFMSWENPGTFGVPSRTLRHSGTELFKTHETGNKLAR